MVVIMTDETRLLQFPVGPGVSYALVQAGEYRLVSKRGRGKPINCLVIVPVLMVQPGAKERPASK